jgi:hypothetical protein
MTNTPSYKTDYAWSSECDYISHVTDKCLHTPAGEQHAAMHNFNFDKACFIGYCQMQRDCAKRDGKDDAAQYIQHCLDDLGEAA